MNNIKSISYKNNNIVLFSLEINENTINLNNKQFLLDKNKDILEKYFANLSLLTINWQENYNSLNVIGGQNWQIYIHFFDNSVKTFSGYAAYPLNFKNFELLNQNLIKEML